jgi:hypothetical protein
MDANLTHKWDIWFHNEKDNWTISGYKKIYEVSTNIEFWKFYNNWDLVGGVTNKHFFIMQSGIIPIWEDVKNINGGCWSFKIHEEQAEELWEDLSVLMVCNKLLPSINNEIVGLSVCLKKNNNVVIKIWNRNSKINSLKLLNEKILKKWGMDIIYIAHMSGQK